MTAAHARSGRRQRDVASGANTLREAAELGSRRVALDLLAAVRDTRDRLDDPGDRTALHDFRVAMRRLRSWLRAFRPQFRDTLRPKLEQRLGRIARVTSTSRDLEVHIGWVKNSRRALPEQGRPGADWLLRRLRGLKRVADAELRDTIERFFAKTMRRVESALERYEARVADDGPRFGDSAADLIDRETGALAAAIQQVSGQGDRAEAHAARIAAKRLRYVLEGLASVGVPSESVVNELKSLQDTLGELHDAQQFGSELATMISKLIADHGNDRSAGRPGRAHRGRAVDPVNGLRLMLRQLRRAEARAFHEFQATWKADRWGLEFAASVASIQHSLR